MAKALSPFITGPIEPLSSSTRTKSRSVGQGGDTGGIGGGGLGLVLGGGGLGLVCSGGGGDGGGEHSLSPCLHGGGGLGGGEHSLLPTACPQGRGSPVPTCTAFPLSLHSHWGFGSHQGLGGPQTGSTAGHACVWLYDGWGRARARPHPDPDPEPYRALTAGHAWARTLDAS